MQYILTEEEYAKLKRAADVGNKLEGRVSVGLSSVKLQKLCTLIANEMPVVWGWGNAPDPKPWGCVLTKPKREREEWVCDKCPVQDLCPHPGKPYSK
jgi:hypothetical protein